VATLFERFLDAIKDTTTLNYCLDARLISPRYMKSCVIDPARKRGVDAVITDYEVPLLTSLNRVLTRDPYGKEACPPLDAIVDGFVRIRQERGNIIRLIRRNKVVKSYELYMKRGDARFLVARKRHGRWSILDNGLYKECLRVPTKAEVRDLLTRKITPKVIERAVSQKDIYPVQKEMLQKWSGYTYEDAVTKHVSGESPVRN
jgi:hypothetical protein